MSLSLFPRMMTEKMTDLTPEFLRSCGIQLLMLDFDNTIVPYTTDVPNDETVQWLNGMLCSGIVLCVVSNSRNQRVPRFCKQYGLGCITHARKPFHDGIEACLNRYGIKREAAALVGDQIFTDTLGANTCGVCSILVKAIDNHNIWLKLRHVAELPFIYAARKRRLKK